MRLVRGDTVSTALPTLPGRLRPRLALSLGLLAVALGAPPARSQSCTVSLDRTPASGAPAALWGELEPTDVGTLPPARDSTDFNEFTQSYSSARMFMDLDVEAGWLFTVYTHGLQIWDARGAKAASPQLVSTAASNRFLAFSVDPHDFEPTRRVDAPAGDAGAIVVATTGGVNIFRTTNKQLPVALYGDAGQSTLDVFAGRVNGRSYAVAANYGGVTVYDMTAAAARTQPCVDRTPDLVSCGAVYLGRLSTQYGATYVHGVGNADGDGLWVATGGLDVGVQVWDLSTPSAPVQLIQDPLGNRAVAGLALFRSGSDYYLALRTSDVPLSQARIYDVGCIASGSCSGLGAPIWSMSLEPDGGVGYLSVSASNGRPYLYYSSFLLCPDGLQQEWLLDASNPSAPVDITPPPAMVDGVLTGYWGFYYRANPTGFNHVRPRSGLFAGDYFYRAAYGILDVHVHETPMPPTADFTYQPAEVYPDVPVSFLDASTRSPDEWLWSFEGGSPDVSSEQNPSVSFGTEGAKTVSLVASNFVGSSAEVSKVVSVLDPAPAIGGIAVSPEAPIVCEPVTLIAEDATGRPPVTIDWEVRNGVETPLAAGAGNPFVWSTESALPGSYTAAVELDNAYGPPAAAELELSLAAPPPLPGSGGFSPTSDPPIEGRIDFDVSVPGASEYCWDFGDGTEYPAGCLTYPSRWSKDPLNGPSPSHTYPGLGTYAVTVQVRNCLDPTPRTSAVHEVEILSTEPLQPMFQAVGSWCFGSQCFAEAGQLIDFDDSTTGSPTLYEYDWDYDGLLEGEFEESSATPITQHAFGRAGTFAPRLRVTRGGEQETYTHPTFFVTGLFDDGFESGDVSGWSDSLP